MSVSMGPGGGGGCAAGWGHILTTGLTIMGSHIVGFLGVRQFFIFTISKRTRMFVLQMKSKVFFIQFKNGSIHKNRKWLSWDRENYIFAQKWLSWGWRWEVSGTYPAKINLSTPLPPGFDINPWKDDDEIMNIWKSYMWTAGWRIIWK